MKLDDALKIVQIAFYVVGATLALLTFRSAKRGLLNTVNTEYHKKVIERLAAVSDELYEELDRNSEEYWINNKPVVELTRRLKEIFDYRSEWFLSEEFDEDRVPVPVLEIEQKLVRLSGKFRSDPFLPTPIRNATLAYLDERANAIAETNREVARMYFRNLHKDKDWEKKVDVGLRIHSGVVGGNHKRKFGVEHVEARVHDIRLLIQDYFLDFSPTNKKMRWTKKYLELRIVGRKLRIPFWSW